MNNTKIKKNFLRINFIALTFLILFSIQDIYSQQDKYKFDKLITNQENFPQEINCVIKDKKGFMWFGTDYGLYRFDGYNFKVYSFKFGDSTFLGINLVNCLFDDDRYLWVGTVQGLNRFDKTTEKFKEFKLSFMNNFIHGIYPAANNELWIRTTAGLNRIDKTKEKYTKFESSDDTAGIFSGGINTLLEDDDGYLWIGTSEKGLYKYDLKKKIFKHYKFSPEDTNSVSSNEISKILEDSKRKLWISTYGGGLNKFDKTTEKFERFKHDSLSDNSIASDTIYHMDIDINENLWIGTSKGICVFDPRSVNFTNLESEDNLFSLTDISDLYCDNTGTVWICSSHEYGFFICNTNKWKFNYYKNISGDNDSLTFNSVTSVCEDHLGNFWIGTDHGIDILNKRKEKIRHFEHIPEDSTSLGSNHVLNIYKDKDDFIWIGTWYGPLDRYDPDKEVFTHFYDVDGKSFRTFQILEDKKKNLWIGLSESGIRVFDSSRTSMKQYLYSKKGLSEYPNLNVTDIFEDSKENIWFGSRFGLATIDLKTDSIIFYKNPNDSTPTGMYVHGINEDINGCMWIGTSNGIKSFDITSKTFKQFNNIKDGGKDYIIGLMKDAKGNFWSTIDKGITMFNLNDKTFTNYGVSDGFQVNTFLIKPQQYKARDGEMFFAGSKGLTSFYPDSIPQNKNIPTIVLTEFRIFNKEVKLDTSIIEKKVITISYKENFFSFDFASLDYTNPTKNQHSYMLEGIDKDWNNVGNVRTANYTDIEPGEYTFRVKGSNNDGVWNEKGVTVKLIITPPWYKTIWFKGLGLLSLLGGIGFIFVKRIKKTNKEKKQQEEFTKKLIESQEDERKRVAAELHDSLGQDLLIIKNKALISLKKADNVAKLKEDIREISDLTSTTINEVREISYNLRPYELDRLGLTKTITSLLERAANSTNINFFREIENIDKVFSPEVEINIYRIIQECISNIIKHSGATEVIVNVKRLEREIMIFISDNGKGFDIEKNDFSPQRKGFGLTGIPERVKLFGGSFNIESEPHKGTKVQIIIPKGS